MGVKIPQFLNLLCSSFFDFVDLLIDLGSQFFKIDFNLISESYITSWSGCDFFDSLKEITVVRQWPVPENSVLVAPLDLFDRNEVFHIERLLKEAHDTLEGRLYVICWVCEQKLGFCIRMVLAESFELLSFLLLSLLKIFYLSSHLMLFPVPVFFTCYFSFQTRFNNN